MSEEGALVPEFIYDDEDQVVINTIPNSGDENVYHTNMKAWDGWEDSGLEGWTIVQGDWWSSDEFWYEGDRSARGTDKGTNTLLYETALTAPFHFRYYWRQFREDTDKYTFATVYENDDASGDYARMLYRGDNDQPDRYTLTAPDGSQKEIDPEFHNDQWLIAELEYDKEGRLASRVTATGEGDEATGVAPEGKHEQIGMQTDPWPHDTLYVALECYDEAVYDAFRVSDPIGLAEEIVG